MDIVFYVLGSILFAWICLQVVAALLDEGM